MKIKLVAYCIAILCFVTSCGPVYEKSYTYRPPKGADGKACASACNDNSSSCNKDCLQSHNLCSTRGDVVNIISKLADKDKKDKKDKDDLQNNSPSDECRKELAQCQGACKSEFNACFQGCGGDVIEHNKCVSMCD